MRLGMVRKKGFIACSLWVRWEGSIVESYAVQSSSSLYLDEKDDQAPIQYSLKPSIYGQNLPVPPPLELPSSISPSKRSSITQNLNVTINQFQNSRDKIQAINPAKIKRLYNKNIEDYMKRFYFRPLFDFYDPFLTFPRRLAAPKWRINIRNQPREYQHEEAQHNDDPYSVFERFYKENELKHQSEKDFFRKYYPEKVEERFDPYKVLEISKDASLEDVKEAYRRLAIKYHPKENSSPEAQAKFAEVSRAYSAIAEPKKSRPYEDYGFNSFFEDFQKEIDSIFANKTEEIKQTKETKESKPAKEGQKESAENYGELYSESSHYETVNGQQVKYVIEKIYKKDGKLVSVKREEKLKDDGKVEITEVIDNGKEVKKKTFTHENDVKKLNS